MTPQGVDFMKRFVPIHHRNTTRIIEGLQVDEQENLVHLLEKLVTHVADLIHTEAFELLRATLSDVTDKKLNEQRRIRCITWPPFR